MTPKTAPIRRKRAVWNDPGMSGTERSHWFAAGHHAAFLKKYADHVYAYMNNKPGGIDPANAFAARAAAIEVAEHVCAALACRQVRYRAKDTSCPKKKKTPRGRKKTAASKKRK